MRPVIPLKFGMTSSGTSFCHFDQPDPIQCEKEIDEEGQVTYIMPEFNYKLPSVLQIPDTNSTSYELDSEYKVLEDILEFDEENMRLKIERQEMVEKYIG